MSTFRIADRTFSSAVDAKHFVCNLLAKYSVGDSVLNSDDMKFLVALLRRNPEYAETLEHGVASIRVVLNKKKKLPVLSVRTKDGAETAADWLECIHPQESEPLINTAADA